MEQQQKDKWQIQLDEQLIVLKKCQNEHNLNSCMQCSEILNCQVREKYISAVYESMNKGTGGGFEF